MQWDDFDGHDDSTFVRELGGEDKFTYAVLQFGGQVRHLTGENMAKGLKDSLSIKNDDEKRALAVEKSVVVLHDVLGSSDVPRLIEDVSRSDDDDAALVLAAAGFGFISIADADVDVTTTDEPAAFTVTFWLSPLTTF